MRTVALAVAGVVALCGAAKAQNPPAPLPNGQPVSNPIPATGGEPGALPGGTDISRPLTPVGPEPTPPNPVVVQETEVKPAKAEKVPKKGPLGPWWDSDELLLWWPKAHPLPPLVTGTKDGSLPVLGRAGTTVLAGGRSIDTQDIAGGRFVRGWSIDHEQTVGLEVSYFFLGSRSADITLSDGAARNTTLGLPYVNAQTGLEDVLTVARPGQKSTYLTASTSTRTQGFEFNGVANLLDREHAKLHFVAGYRYFQLNEGLRLEQSYAEVGNGLITTARVADQFDTANRFSGGQLGLHADFHKGPFFIELVAKAALGRNFEVARINGETHAVTVAPGGVPLVRGYPAGVYALPTNSGRVTHSAFAVVPEGTFKFGLRASEGGRIFVAYNFLYLSDAIRPGDQVDRTLNPSLIPLLNGGGSFAGPERPLASVNRTDFWVQGLVIGLEARY